MSWPWMQLRGGERKIAAERRVDEAFQSRFVLPELSFWCFDGILHALHSNTEMLLIPCHAACFSVYCCTLQQSLCCSQWLSDGLPLPNLFSGSPLRLLSVNLQPSYYWPEMPCWSNGGAVQLAGELRRGKEGIDLSVVLGDQLIPIVCASTDSPMCLIWYGLFLLSQDKSLSHHFPLWATNQIKSKGMTARRGFLPRLWLADHNKGRPSIWKVVCAE